ncbi:hypothetical protein Vretimale_4336 [Volvox reticuliferus]|uniref:Uncharacterized protein n=1 Tax=Volvox reticuliferus TaxID=1737510 RepID=A0A8J4FE85_9CHLO|nr:hypothetical protein Vretifemale_2942 [Volvox reticuliferus]GIL99091.1 hypothetical protein Vretimale_4336 [Volvox reticuliferus]
MAAATVLCRQAELLGATFDRSSGCVLVTIQGDGVQSYNLQKRQLGSLALGSRAGLKFQVASVQHHGRAQPDGEGPLSRVVASVVQDCEAKNHSLCLCDLGGATRPLSDAPCRVALPGPSQSCHFLRQHDEQHHTAAAVASTRRLAAAVVLADGRIGIADVHPAGSAGPVHVLPCGLETIPHHVLATSLNDTLLVALQSAAGNPATLRVLRLTSGMDGSNGGLTQSKALTLPCPGANGAAAANTVITGLTMSSAFALLQWSNGHATVVHGIQSGAAALPLRPCTLPLADAVLTNGVSASTSAPSTTPVATASGRKRKNAAAASSIAAGSGVRPRVLCAAMDERQFLVLDLDSSAAQSQVCFSLHDAQFGCPLLSGAFEVDTPLPSLDISQCSIVAAGPEGTILRLGNSVHVVNIQAQPVNLLSLVARLSVAAGPVVGGAQVKFRPCCVGAAAAAKALVTLPAPVSLDPALLVGRAPTVVTAAVLNGVADDDAQDIVLEPVPPAAVSHLEDICNSLVEQLSAAAGGAPSQALLDSAVSYVIGRRQHGMAVPPQLLSLAARGLAVAKQWNQLQALLRHVPEAGLNGCSDVLVAAVMNHKYFLLTRLATCLDEVEPAALVDTLQLLLAPTTRNNLMARQTYYETLRGLAETHISMAEHALTAPGTRPPSAAAVRNTTAQLAKAQCAAAVVDGFSYREVALHPLIAIPVDAPAVQFELRRLSATAADALLAYLAKWVLKYTDGIVGESANHLSLPEGLIFPFYHQVLEWTRITIDAHLTRLLMARKSLPALESMETALNSAMEGNTKLIMLRGALEHVNSAAPLPAAHIAVATQYTAEVLDLRVR